MLSEVARERAQSSRGELVEFVPDVYCEKLVRRCVPSLSTQFVNSQFVDYFALQLLIASHKLFKGGLGASSIQI